MFLPARGRWTLPASVGFALPVFAPFGSYRFDTSITMKLGDGMVVVSANVPCSPSISSVRRRSKQTDRRAVVRCQTEGRCSIKLPSCPTAVVSVREHTRRFRRSAASFKPARKWLITGATIASTHFAQRRHSALLLTDISWRQSSVWKNSSSSLAPFGSSSLPVPYPRFLASCRRRMLVSK